MADVHEVFGLLDKWKQHPNYQLERRADIFFAVYLQAVLTEYIVATREIVIPELPVKQGANNLSDKVDYMALSEDGQVMMLIELKTEALGHRPEQVEYLIRAAAELEPEGILRGLREVMNVSRSKKYASLQGDLQQLGLWGAGTLELPDRCQIVFIQPTQYVDEAILDQFRRPKQVPLVIIDFHMFADVVERQGSALSVRFAQSLREWARSAEEEIQTRRHRQRRDAGS